METYPSASILRRCAAGYIDIGIVTLLVTPVFFLGIDLNEPGRVFTYFGLFLFASMIFFICKDCFKGVSLGRWIMGIAVRDGTDTNTIPDKKRLIMRNLSMLVWPMEFFALLLSKDKIR